MFLLTQIEERAFEYYCEAKALATQSLDGTATDLSSQLKKAAINILVRREDMSEDAASSFLADEWTNSGKTADAVWAELQKRTIAYYCANTIWKVIMSWIASAMNKMSFAFMSNFAPDMSTYLTMFGYNDGPDAYSAIVWTSATNNTILNAFSIFAVIGYVLAITILVISLFKVSLANVTDTRDTTVHLAIRFIVSFLLITYSNSVISVFLKVTQTLWDKIIAINDATQTSVKAAFTSDNVEAQVTSIGIGSGAIQLTDMNFLIGCMFLILMFFSLLHTVVEMVEKYLVVGFLYITFPTIAATFVSRDTENIIASYFRMLISELFLLIMNAWFVTMFCNLLNNIGNSGMTPYAQCITAIAFLKFAQKLDQYIQGLGLNAAVTGSGLLDQIMASIGSTIALPGRTARSVQSVINKPNKLHQSLMANAINSGDYAAAGHYAEQMNTPTARQKAFATLRHGMKYQDLSAEELKASGLDHIILNGDGKGVSDLSAGEAIRLNGERFIAQAIAKQYGIPESDVVLSDGATYNAKDHSWHMTADVNGQTIAFKVTPDDFIKAKNLKDNSVAGFTDSKGTLFKVSLDDVANQDKKTKEDIKNAAKFQDGYIKNPIQAEAATGIHNDYGVRINADGSVTPLDKNGNLTGERYVANGKGGYVSAYGDEVISKAAGFGTETYQSKPIDDFIDSNGNILNKDAAKAFTGIDNDYGLHVIKDKDGNMTFQRLDPAFEEGDYKPLDTNEDDKGKFIPKEKAMEMGADFGHMDTSGYDMNKYEAGIYVDDDGTYSYALRPKDEEEKEESHKLENNPDDDDDYFDGFDDDDELDPEEEERARQKMREAEEEIAREREGNVHRTTEEEIKDINPFMFDPANRSDDSADANSIEQPKDSDLDSSPTEYPEDFDLDASPIEQPQYSDSVPSPIEQPEYSEAPLDNKDDENTKKYERIDSDDNVLKENRKHVFGFSDIYDASINQDGTIHMSTTVRKGDEGDIKVNSDGSYTPLNGCNAGSTLINNTSRKANVPFGSPVNVMRNSDGQYVKVAEGSDTYQASRMEMHNLKTDNAGGYTATMTVRGIYSNDMTDRNAASIKVRIGDSDSRQGNEVLISKFKDDTTGETKAIFTDKREMGNFVKQSAGKTFENKQLGRAAMQMSTKKMDEYAANIGSPKIGNVYKVNQEGNTVSRMNSGYSATKNVSYRSKAGSDAENKAKATINSVSSSSAVYAKRVVSTRYDDTGRKLYDYCDQRTISKDEDVSVSRQQFEEWYREKYAAPDDDVQVRPIRKRDTMTTDYRVTVTNPDGETRTRVFRNAANISGSTKVTKSDARIKDDHGNVWVDVKLTK